MLATLFVMEVFSDWCAWKVRLILQTVSCHNKHNCVRSIQITQTQLMHQKLPFFMEKTAKNGFFFRQKLSFLASDKQLTPLPYFEGAGCKTLGCGQT